MTQAPKPDEVRAASLCLWRYDTLRTRPRDQEQLLAVWDAAARVRGWSVARDGHPAPDLNLPNLRLRSLPNCLDGWGRIQRLNLDGNRLPQAQLASLANLGSLRDLSLAANALSTLPNELTGLRGLECLNLADNELVTVPAAVMGLTHLKRLSMPHNRLIALPTLASPWPRAAADDVAVRVWPRLQMLELDGNQLTELPTLLAALTGLQRLSLAGNPLRGRQAQGEAEPSARPLTQQP